MEPLAELPTPEAWAAIGGAAGFEPAFLAPHQALEVGNGIGGD
jgi:hypothetical protein